MSSAFWRRPWFALLLLWLSAVVLALHGLGNLPLRDWDEAIVARVALEISRSSWPDVLLPTYLGSSYLNKPPGMHLPIAGLIRLWQWASGADGHALPPEWLLRLIPALGSTLLVPLMGLVQERLRPGRWGAAMATSLVTLTLLPLARHGRLAMLDGTQLSAMALVWLGLLWAGSPPRRALVGGLLAGVGGSALLLMKAPVALPVLLGALVLRWSDHGLDRRGWRWLVGGLLLGLAPGLGWHLWHGLARGTDAFVMWGPQGMARLTSTVENHRGGIAVPLVQVLSGGWPWLPLWPFGIGRAWRERLTQAGRWTLGLTALSTLLVFPLRTQLPWYSLLLWPPFALTTGPVLSTLVVQGSGRIRMATIRWIWVILGGAMLAAVALSLTPIGQGLSTYRALVLPAGLGLFLAGCLLGVRAPPGRRLAAVLALAGGWILSLLLLFGSPLWNWELNEQPPLGPAIELAREAGSSGTSRPLLLLSSRENEGRPSFRWYFRSLPSFLADAAAIPPDREFLVISDSEDPRTLPHVRCILEQTGSLGWKRWLCHS